MRLPETHEQVEIPLKPRTRIKQMYYTLGNSQGNWPRLDWKRRHDILWTTPSPKPYENGAWNRLSNISASIRDHSAHTRDHTALEEMENMENNHLYYARIVEDRRKRQDLCQPNCTEFSWRCLGCGYQERSWDCPETWPFDLLNRRSDTQQKKRNYGCRAARRCISSGCRFELSEHERSRLRDATRAFPSPRTNLILKLVKLNIKLDDWRDKIKLDVACFGFKFRETNKRQSSIHRRREERRRKLGETIHLVGLCN